MSLRPEVSCVEQIADERDRRIVEQAAYVATR